MGRIHPFDGVTESVEGVNLTHCQHSHSEHSPFPRIVKDRLIFFSLDRTETSHPTHVVHTIHSCPRSSLGIRREEYHRLLYGSSHFCSRLFLTAPLLGIVKLMDHEPTVPQYIVSMTSSEYTML